jgi:hypothetical protein
LACSSNFITVASFSLDNYTEKYQTFSYSEIDRPSIKFVTCIQAVWQRGRPTKDQNRPNEIV